MRPSWLLAFTSSFLALAAACSSSDAATATSPVADAGAPDAEPEGCPTGGTGSLDLEIVGTDAPDEWAVTVEGVDERSSERVGSTTFLRLPTGRYRIMAETVTSPVHQGQDAALVRHVYVPSVPTPVVCVRADKTPIAHVTYNSLPTDGALFMAHENAAGQVARLSLPSIGLSRSTVDTFDVRAPAARGLAFDVGGNLWVAADGVVERIPGANLESNGVGSGTPDRRLAGALFAGTPGPTALAFDSDGDLWVSLPGAKSIVELSSSSLNVSGAPSANVVIDSASFAELPAMAFDEGGDLFVASGDHVLRYRAARLATSTSDPPDVDVTTTWKRIRDLAFDASGNLWVAYAGSDVLARLEPSDLDGVGARKVIPKIEVTLATSGVLDAIAFDEAGGIWLGYGPAKLGRIGPEQLAVSGTVTPDQLLDGIRLGTVSRLAFFPGAAGTPLFSALP